MRAAQIEEALMSEIQHPSESYPYLALASARRLDYGLVLLAVDEAERSLGFRDDHPGASSRQREAYDGLLPEDLAALYETVEREHQRRSRFLREEAGLESRSESSASRSR